MKIAILSYWFSPYYIGGSELAVYRYANALALKGHEVHVITQLDDRRLPRYEITEGFHVHRIRRWRLRILGSSLYFLSVYWKVRKLKPDIIHEQAIQGIGAFIKRLSDIPYVLFPRGTDLYFASSFFRKFLVKFALSNADALLAQTPHMAREMKEICLKEAVVIPNGVDPDRFMKFPREEARHKLGITEQEKIVLCVANLREEKGQKYLIKAMKKVVIDYPESRLFIVGNDFQNGKIQRLALEKDLEQKAVFTGFIPPDEVPEYMAAADVFALPSLGEGFPNALLEAMAAWLPVVATEVGGVPDIVTDGENDFLVEPMNSEQLAEKILFLLQNSEVGKYLSSNNTKKAKGYDWSNITTSLEKVYIKVKNR